MFIIFPVQVVILNAYPCLKPLQKKKQDLLLPPFDPCPHRLVVLFQGLKPIAHLRQDIMSLLQVCFEPFTLQLLDVVLLKSWRSDTYQTPSDHLQVQLECLIREVPKQLPEPWKSLKCAMAPRLLQDLAACHVEETNTSSEGSWKQQGTLRGSRDDVLLRDEEASRPSRPSRVRAKPLTKVVM